MADELTMESTTDSAEQIREGMGLPKADQPVVVTPPVEAAAATEETPVVEPTTETPAEPIVEPPVEETPVQARDAEGKFVAAPKRKPVAAQPRIDALTREKAEERAARVVAETENAALKRRLEELAVGRPATQPAVDQPATIDPDTFRDPAITVRFTSQRNALKEPKQEDFEDFNEFRRAERAYDRQLATLDANELSAHQRAAERASIAAQEANHAAQQRFTTYNERVNASKARHADYDAVMQAGMAIPFKGRPYAADLQQAIIESEQGPEIVYHLAKHPEELARLQALPSVHVAMVELGALAAQVKATVVAHVPAGATQTGPATPAPAVTTRPVSRAPEPQGTALGGSTSVAAASLDDPNISQAEYNRRRNAQDKARRGR